MRLHTKFFIAISIVVVLAATAYGVLLPTIRYNNYQARLNTLIRDVDTGFYQQAATIEDAIFYGSELPLADQQRQISIISKRNEVLRQKLAHMADTAARVDSPPPGISLTPVYRKAIVEQDRVLGIVAQSNEVLADYQSLLVFLSTYDTQQAKLTKELSLVNNQDNIDSLAGRSGELRAAAARINAYAEQLDKAPAPAEFSAFKAEALTTFAKSSQAYIALADALETPIDSKIYAAVQQVEAAAIKNDVGDKEKLSASSEASQIMRSVGDLPDKTEFLGP